MNPDAKLGMIERLAYGMGDFGGNLIYTAISSFLLVYYVSVVGIPSAAAGSILAISKIFDGISDGKWMTNVQAVGMGNAASSFTMKIGSGIGTAALGWILAAGSFTRKRSGRNPGSNTTLSAGSTEGQIMALPAIPGGLTIGRSPALPRAGCPGEKAPSFPGK